MTPPLRIFDRYVLRIFVRSLLFALLAAVLIFVVVDLIEHLDTFIDKKVSYGIVLLYYGYFLPYIVYLLLPVAALLAALFTVGGLSRSHELTAMKASGIGLYRIYLHLLAVGLVVSGITFCFGETVVPYTNKQSKDLYNLHVKKITPDKAAKVTKVYLRNRPGEMVRVERFDLKTLTAFDLDWQRFEGEALRERLNARQAVWTAVDSTGRDSAWVGDDARLWSFSAGGVKLVKVKKQAFPDLGFKPADLTKGQKDPEQMGYWQLKPFVERLQMLGGNPQKWLVELAFKISTPFTSAIVILLGVPIAARHRRSGLMLAVGSGLLISFIYFALQQFGRVMGYNGTLPPELAAWLGNGVFVVVGLWLYWRVGK